MVFEIVGPGAKIAFSAAADRFVWTGETGGIGHAVRFGCILSSGSGCGRWPLRGAPPVQCDAILVQDIGLGNDGFVMNNEAYASQYVDHHVVHHPTCGPVVLSRQNLPQSSGHPWVAHGCLDGAVGFATDAMQLFGPQSRDGGADRRRGAICRARASSTRSPVR